jgi:hypothetical protein
VGPGLGFVQRPGEDQIIVPLGAVFAAKRTQQKTGKDQDFKKASAVRPANIQAFAGRTAPQQVNSLVRHNNPRAE